MTALKTTQASALAALAALLTEATTGLRYVYTDHPDSIITPCMVVRDVGCGERREGQWRIVEWDLELSIYTPLSPTVPKAYARARDIRADVIDQLGTDITLGGTVSNSYWLDPVRLTGLRWGGTDEEGGTMYAGAIGTYRLVVKEAKAFA